MKEKDFDSKQIQTEFQISVLNWDEDRKIDFTQSEIEKEKIENWPMVYILSNQNKYQRQAYVGKTTSIFKRIGKQHSKDPNKNRFDKVQIIFNESFNESVISDYESRLIQLLSAGEYRLLNQNDGLKESNYFQKEYYDKLFPYLWEELRRKKIVHHTLDEIEGSDFFKYSPYKQLNENQLAAAQEILEAIKEESAEPRPLVVEGFPGTGKTILAMYLLKYLKDREDNKNKVIKLLMPIRTLRNTLKRVADSIPGLSSDDILDAFDLVDYDKIDILLVDEAHRLEEYKNFTVQKYLNYREVCKKLGLNHKEVSQYHWILEKAELPVFFFDPYQIIRPNNPSYEKVKEILGDSLKKTIKLSDQMRIRGGEEYLNYILSILDGNQKEKKDFGKYEVLLHKDFESFYQSFQNDLRKDPLTRMIAGYAWKWNSKKNKTVADFFFGETELQWNSTINEWIYEGLENWKVANEVGCIHTVQGYDLDNAYVIIGDDLVFNSTQQVLGVDKDNYFDIYGKKSASPEELEEYIKKIYFILLTRGIKSTHIYVPNPELRQYFQKFFDVV